MVVGLLDGRKTQTRRMTKYADLAGFRVRDDGVTVVEVVEPNGLCCFDLPCPYGKPGDRLWVREEYYQRGHWAPIPFVATKTGRQKWAFVPTGDVVLFDAPAEYARARAGEDRSVVRWHKRLGRFMPRRFSRITLEVTGVRVERLQSISEADAKAEGVEPIGERWRDYFSDVTPPASFSKASNSFWSLWGAINGADSWAANPWVWVVEFKVTP